MRPVFFYQESSSITCSCFQYCDLISLQYKVMKLVGNNYVREAYRIVICVVYIKIMVELKL
jgi:hypothetical protein